MEILWNYVNSCPVIDLKREEKQVKSKYVSLKATKTNISLYIRLRSELFLLLNIMA